MASMKALPKRKGNSNRESLFADINESLNESPSEKEGKYHRNVQVVLTYEASMKALPKRKGNPQETNFCSHV